MHFVKGRVARQAHVDLPEGTVEEEFGRQGFFGRYAHLYRKKPPVDWIEVDEGLRPRALSVRELPGLGKRHWHEARVPFLKNSNVSIEFARLDQAPASCFRNADGDEILFVHNGSGHLDCDFGSMEFKTGDYLVVPRGTTYRIHPDTPCEWLVIESRGEVSLPDRGLLGQHALFDPNVIAVPSPRELPDDSPECKWPVWVKRQDKLFSITYPFDPLNTVGYKGDLTVWRLNVNDIRPVASERYHLPPSAHATFISDPFVLCTFLPRPLEVGDEKAMKVPFYHSNIDFDEVIFYHAGQFFSRAGIAPGMVTFHPQGIHHGPQPQAIEAAKDKQRTDEIAIMIDTKEPLELTEAAHKAQVTDYWKSWQRNKT